jgi:hypothetical protein
MLGFNWGSSAPPAEPPYKLMQAPLDVQCTIMGSCRIDELYALKSTCGHFHDLFEQYSGSLLPASILSTFGEAGLIDLLAVRETSRPEFLNPRTNEAVDSWLVGYAARRQRVGTGANNDYLRLPRPVCDEIVAYYFQTIIPLVDLISRHSWEYHTRDEIIADDMGFSGLTDPEKDRIIRALLRYQVSANLFEPRPTIRHGSS